MSPVTPPSESGVEALRRIAEAATPGPWKASKWGLKEDEWPFRRVSVATTGSLGHAIVISPRYADPEDTKDADFIATFNPALVSLLLDVAEAAESETGPHPFHDRRGETCSLCSALAALRAATPAPQTPAVSGEEDRDA